MSVEKRKKRSESGRKDGESQGEATYESEALKDYVIFPKSHE